MTLAQSTCCVAGKRYLGGKEINVHMHTHVHSCTHTCKHTHVCTSTTCSLAYTPRQHIHTAPPHTHTLHTLWLPTTIKECSETPPFSSQALIALIPYLRTPNPNQQTCTGTGVCKQVKLRAVSNYKLSELKLETQSVGFQRKK